MNDFQTELTIAKELSIHGALVEKLTAANYKSRY